MEGGLLEGGSLHERVWYVGNYGTSNERATSPECWLSSGGTRGILGVDGTRNTWSPSTRRSTSHSPVGSRSDAAARHGTWRLKTKREFYCCQFLCQLKTSLTTVQTTIIKQNYHKPVFEKFKWLKLKLNLFKMSQPTVCEYIQNSLIKNTILVTITLVHLTTTYRSL